MSKRFIKWLTKFEKPSSQKGMVGWLIKNGVVESKKMANTLLLCTSVFFFVMSGLLFVM